MSCLFCSDVGSVILKCGCHVHIECFRTYCNPKTRFECPKCRISVTKAHYDAEQSEWIIGIVDAKCLHGCFKVTQCSKVVPFNGVMSKWRRCAGRLKSIDWMDLTLDIYVS